MEADGTAYLAEEVIRLFGDHTTALGLLMHLSLLAKDMPKGEIRDGITLATEAGAAWLDRQDGDGRDTMQTLMEHVTGLLNGAYALVDVGAPIQTLYHPAPDPQGWPGPGERPHTYSPDYMAMGDCRICGHTRDAHYPVAPLTGEGE